LTEPLFDLPLEVLSGDSVHVVRSYSVLLDPEETGAAPQKVAESSLTHDGPVPAAVNAGVPQTTQADVGSVAGKKTAGTRHRASRRASTRAAKHLRSRAHAPSVARASGPATPLRSATAPAARAQLSRADSQDATAQAKGSAQEQLERQLATLQQTLTQMQATIAAQDAEIAKLTQRLSASDSPPGAGSTAPSADSDANTDDDAQPTSFWLRPSFLYWVASGLGLAAVLAAVSFWLARRHKAESAPGVAISPQPTAAATSVRPVITSEAPKRNFPFKGHPSYDVEEHSGDSHADGSAGATDSHAAAESSDDAYAAGVLEGQGDSDGMEDWRTQTALLEQDILSATDALPFVMDEQNQVKPIGNPASSPAAEEEKTLELQQTLASLEMQPDQPATNRDVVKALESTLDIDPDRVDVQLKLLEIYHHEALGNRDNFHLLLRKLNVEQDALSPAQRSHLEILRRTLEDGKQDSNFATEAAV
jgi:hypothetical protein